MTKLDEMYQRLREQLTDREREVLDARLAERDSKLDPKLEPTSKPDRVAREMAQAREDFSKHEISKVDNSARWLVRQPGTSTFWFEVVILAGGSMIVHGDIQAVIFGRYHPSKNTPDLIAAVQTMPIRLSPKGTSGSVGVCQSPPSVGRPSHHRDPAPRGSTSSAHLLPRRFSASGLSAPSSRSTTC